jgi:excisionase family DNA binding protein
MGESRGRLTMPRAVADLPLLATPKQAAEVMGPTESQIRGLIRSGRLAHTLVGARVMIPRDAIEAFIINNTVTPCRAETRVPTSTGIATASLGTSPGPSEAAAGSAARALRIAASLKSPSPNSSMPATAERGRVIRPQCS